MKRVLKIIVGIVIGIFLLLLILPFFFKGTIEKKMKEEINKQVNATVGWDKIRLSLIKDFPDLSFGIDGLFVVGKDQFQNDTLLGVDRFSVTVDVFKAISGDIQIKEITIENPLINAIVAADSAVNWDIMIPSEEEEVVEEDTTESGSDMMAHLQLLKITDGEIWYKDYTSQLITGIEGFNTEMSGDLGATITRLDIKASIENLSLKMEESQYLNKVSIGLDTKIESDLDKMIFTFAESNLSINQLSMGIDGSFGMPEEGYDIDVRLFARQTDFKTLLGLVPADMMKGYEDIKTTGSLALEATMKGRYIDTDHLPAFNFLLKVNDASLQYPDLPESIQDIQISTSVINPGGSMDASVTTIDKFHFKLGTNPFDASLNVVTPISNATFKGGMVGTIDLGSLKNALPLDSMSLKGIITSDITIAGDYNMIAKEQYESIKADGSVVMNNFEYSSTDLPIPYYIDNAILKFSPRYLNLTDFKSRMGKSDYNLKGQLDNYLGYALKDGTLKGTLSLYSKYINLDELMTLGGEDTVAVEETDTSTMEPVIIPKNIDFVMASKIDRMKYDKLMIQNTTGKITIKDGRLILDGLNLNLLGGTMVMSGQYNTQDEKKPFMDFAFDASKINLNSAANAFSMIDSIIPVAKLARGIVSTKLSYSSLVGNDMMPVVSTVNGKGNLKSEGIELSGSKVQTGLATMLKDEKYKSFTAKDLLVNFKLTNGNLFIEPFETKIYDKSVTVQGRQGIDQSMEYKISMPVSRQDLSKLGGLLGMDISSSGSDLPVDVIVKGKTTDPELSLDLDKAKKQIEKEAGEKVTKEVEKQVDKLMEDPEVKKKVDEAKKKLNNLFK